MNNRIRQIAEQITALETELDAAIEEHEQRLLYQLEGRRVVFEQAVRDAHRRVKLGVFRWFLTVRPQNYLTMPIIYGAIIPMTLLDLCLSLYQLICFPVYRIARVKRGDYIVFDHQHLAYLNIIEKAHCLYCSYAVGLLAYATEIIARTEQYFCPIKHARRVRAAHARYKNFLDYGEADDYHGKLEEFRAELAQEADAKTATKKE
ncbi:MAG TPA: hypothetical protein VFW59_08370 [Gallionella sp.]|nr:hypothetical protein [Gallionella sp.]